MITRWDVKAWWVRLTWLPGRDWSCEYTRLILAALRKAEAPRPRRSGKFKRVGR